MDFQTLIVAITVGLAAAIVIRTFTRQFTSRGQKGCSSCGHSQTGAARDEQLIQVESIRE